MDSPFIVSRRRAINKQRAEEANNPKSIFNKVISKAEKDKPAITVSVQEFIKKYRGK